MVSEVQEKKTPSAGTTTETAKGSPGAEESAPRRQGRRRGRLIAAILVVAAGALGTFGYWFFFMRGIVYTDDARLAGDVVDVAPEISGRLTAVAAREGSYVHKGDVIFRVSESSYTATVRRCEAALESAGANLALSKAKLARELNGSRPEQIRATEATVERLRSQEELAKLYLERIQRAVPKGAATQEELDSANSAYESAHYSMINAEQELALLEQGPRQEDIEAARAAVKLADAQVGEAQAALDKARSDLAKCVVAAPFDGWVVRRWLEPGAMPVAGQPVVSVFQPSSLRVDANIEEKDLYRVAVDDRVSIHVDAYPSLSLTGRVTQVLRATKSQFSLIPAEGVSGTYIKVSQRIPLRIAVSDPPPVLLAPGLSVEARIRVGSHSAGLVATPPHHD